MLAPMPTEQMVKIKQLIHPAFLRNRTGQLEKEVHNNYQIALKTCIGWKLISILED